MDLLYRPKPEHKPINPLSREELNTKEQQSGVWLLLCFFLIIVCEKPKKKV